ncbi:MAG: hypothetical protein JSR96_14515 [Proteobacteria bacterium]|nr:hypothetical protein [Pseudomonadota bacterium]
MALWSLALFVPPASAQEVSASDPTDLSVTIYRDPNRNGGNLQLNALGGFAVVTETRRVTLPAGRARLRFVGVVDGIIPESAIVTGLPGGVIEKNRDAALLSPATLLRAVQGKQVQLRRTNRDTGKTELVPAKVISASEDGVLFETAAGKEALRCSGFPETFAYGIDTAGLSAKPVLSVQTRSPRAMTTEVKLTYLAQGFDWSASYTGDVNPAARTMNLGGWITLANGNSVSLPDAQVQIVAGGLRREAWRRLIDGSARAVARCWPMQRTHMIPQRPERPYQLVRPYERQIEYLKAGFGLAEDAAMDIVVTGAMRRESVVASPVAAPPPPPPPPPEQLGDLKLYRVPHRTTIAARQMKQTRLIEQSNVGFERIYRVTFAAMDPNVSDYLNDRVGADWQRGNPEAILRTKNDKAHNLGLPLPSGAFVISQDQGQRTMMIGQPDLRDTAEDEKVELALGPAPDVTVERRTVSRGKRYQRQEIKISNAGAEPVTLELRYNVWGAIILDDADGTLTKQDGLPTFTLNLAPNSVQSLHYTVRWQ